MTTDEIPGNEAMRDCKGFFSALALVRASESLAWFGRHGLGTCFQLEGAEETSFNSMVFFGLFVVC